MLKHKFLSTIRTFTKAEFNDFEKFIQSPYHNEGRNYISVLRSLKKYYPEFSSKNLTKENIFQNSYPEESYSENKLNIALTRLYKMADDFLVINNLKKNEFEKQRILLGELTGRKLFSKFDKNAGLAEGLIDPDSSFSEKYFEEKSIIYRLKAERVFSADEIYSGKQVILKRTEYTLYSVINRMILCRYDLTLFHNEFGAEFDTGFVEYFFKSVDIESILEKLNEFGSEYYSVLALKYYGILLRTPCEEKTYLFYKDLINKHLGTLSFEEKFVYFNNLAAFCIRKSNEGITSFDNELMDIYRQMLDQKLISHIKTDYFDLTHYRNMLLSALEINDLEFIDEHLIRNSEFLNPVHKEDMTNFTYAKLYFAKNDVERSLEFASRVNQEFFLFKIDIKCLLLQLYFESAYYEELFSLVDSFRHFITGKEDISEGRKNRYLNLLKYLSAIAKLKINSDQDKLLKLKEEINSGIEIALKGWINSKLSELTQEKE